jgi:hypothetical protein
VSVLLKIPTRVEESDEEALGASARKARSME